MSNGYFIPIGNDNILFCVLIFWLLGKGTLSFRIQYVKSGIKLSHLKFELRFYLVLT